MGRARRLGGMTVHIVCKALASNALPHGEPPASPVPPLTPPARSTSSWGRCAHAPRSARTSGASANTTRGERVPRKNAKTQRRGEAAKNEAGAHRLCGSLAPVVSWHTGAAQNPTLCASAVPRPPRDRGPEDTCHMTVSKECLYRMLSRQEEIFGEPRRARRRAPVRESPTVRSGKTGNLDGTSEKTR